MPLDPRIALGVQQYQAPNMLEMAQNAMAVRNAQQANQLNQMKLAQEQQAMQQAAGLQNYLASNPDLSSAEAQNQLVSQYGSAGLDILNRQQELANRRLAGQVSQQEYDANKHKQVQEGISKIAGYTNKADALKGLAESFEKGTIDEDSYNRLERQISSTPLWSDARRGLLLNLMTAEKQLETVAPNWTERSDNQQKWLVDTNPNSATYGQEQKGSRVKLQLTPVQAEKAEKGTTLTPAQATKLKAAKAEDISNYKVTKDTATDLTNLVDSLLGNKAKNIPEHPGLGSVTGLASLLPLSKIPQSDASAAQNIIDTISGKVNVIGRNLAQVSGKLGNMAVQEWEKVAASVQKLNPKAKNFPEQLRSVVDTANRLEKNMRDKYKFEYDEELPGSSGGDGDWSDL